MVVEVLITIICFSIYVCLGTTLYEELGYEVKYDEDIFMVIIWPIIGLVIFTVWSYRKAKAYINNRTKVR